MKIMIQNKYVFNDNNSYSVYANGWIEQHDTRYDSVTGKATVALFFVLFKNTNYLFIPQGFIQTPSVTSANWYGSEVRSSTYTRTNSRAYIKGDETGVCWYAEGY